MRRLVIATALAGCLATAHPVSGATAPKVVVVGLEDADVQRLQRAVPQLRLVAVPDHEAALREIPDADGLVGRPAPELLAAGRKLRWVQVLSAGVDRWRDPSLVDSDITLTNAKIVQGPNVADHAMALLLVLTRGIHTTLAHRDERDWSSTRGEVKTVSPPIELSGRTAVVIGLGGIGAAIAHRSQAFGMKILAVNRTVDKPHEPYVARIYPPSALHEALGQADVVFMAAPLTEETRGMLDADAFAAMKPGAYFVNIGRGATVDTDAMVASLRRGHLAGAGLDVTDPEPLPREHPLWTLDNVVVTPHLGGSSDGVWARKLDLVEDNLRRFRDGKDLRNEVDKALGY